MDFYGCLYFDSDKSVSVVPRSRCVLRVPFEAGNEAEVSWRCHGEKQRFIGTILKTAKKDQKEQIDQFAVMADRSIDQWLKSGEDVKAKLAVLIATPFPVNAGADEATEETNAKNPRKRIRKETAIMQESKEQEKSEKGPATKKKKKDDNLVEDRGAKTQEKHPKKASSKSKADKSKETHTHLTNLANKSAAESEASVNAAKDIFNTFKGAFSRASKQTDQVSDMVTLDLDDSDEEGQTNAETAGEVSLSTTDPVEQHKAVPLRLGQTHFQQQITPLTFPPRPAVPVTPLIGIGQEILPQSQSVVSTSRAATSLLETADALAEVRAMSSQLGGDEDCYPSGGFREFLARPLNHDSSQDRKEIIELREENNRLRDEIAILKSKLISSARNQPVPSAEVLQYMRDVLALNTVDGTELLPEVADVPTQQYTIRANLEPRVSQTPNDAVKLLEKSDVVVNRNTLRSVVQSGHAKGALHLLKKLIPLVFSTEELGNSCGQGIGKGGKTNNDGKRPLSQHKVNTCKDYITAFCIQNGKDHPSEKDINQAFTQQVTYARTKLNINQKASASSS